MVIILHLKPAIKSIVTFVCVVWRMLMLLQTRDIEWHGLWTLHRQVYQTLPLADWWTSSECNIWCCISAADTTEASISSYLRTNVLLHSAKHICYLCDLYDPCQL